MLLPAVYGSTKARRCGRTGEFNPLFPPSGPAIGSFNGLHPKSKFLAAKIDKCECLRFDQ